MKITELCRNTWCITDDFVHLYLLKGSTRALLIDAGATGLDLRGIAAGLGCPDPELLLTHADPDHTAGAADFPECRLHPGDFWLFEQSRPGIVVRPLWEGETIDLGNRTVEPILIPGHTPGSLAFLEVERRILYAGDLVQKDVPIHMFGRGRSVSAYVEGLERLYSYRDRFDKIYPGHGPMPLSSADILNIIQTCRLYLEHRLEPAQHMEQRGCYLYRWNDVQIYAD